MNSFMSVTESRGISCAEHSKLTWDLAAAQLLLQGLPYALVMQKGEWCVEEWVWWLCPRCTFTNPGSKRRGRHLFCMVSQDHLANLFGHPDCIKHLFHPPRCLASCLWLHRHVRRYLCLQTLLASSTCRNPCPLDS